MGLSDYDQLLTKNAVVDINNRTDRIEKALAAIADNARHTADALLKPTPSTGDFRPIDVLVSQVIGSYSLLSKRTDGIDIAALATAIVSRLDPGSDVDEVKLAASLRAALAPDLAALNANIDDQPTEFTIAPK